MNVLASVDYVLHGMNIRIFISSLIGLRSVLDIDYKGKLSAMHLGKIILVSIGRYISRQNNRSTL